MRKKFILILIFLMLFTTGCGQKKTYTDLPEEKEITPAKVIIAGLKGPTSMGMIKMIDNNSLSNSEYDVSFTIDNTPDNLTGKIINDEVHIAAVPTNMASILYNKTKGKIQFLALNTLGVLHITGRESITGIPELKGKTIALSGKGAAPEFVMKYILSEKELSEEISLKYYPDHSSLAQAIISGDEEYALLPQPFVSQVLMKTSQDKSPLQIVADINKVWESMGQEKKALPMGCLIVNKEFAERNPEFVVKFLSAYEKSVEWVNNNHIEAGKLIKKHNILPDENLAALAIPGSSIVYYSSDEASDTVNDFLEILYGFNPKSVGGKLPDENFYYKGKSE